MRTVPTWKKVVVSTSLVALAGTHSPAIAQPREGEVNTCAAMTRYCMGDAYDKYAPKEVNADSSADNKQSSEAGRTIGAMVGFVFFLVLGAIVVNSSGDWSRPVE